MKSRHLIEAQAQVGEEMMYMVAAAKTTADGDNDLEEEYKETTPININGAALRI